MQSAEELEALPAGERGPKLWLTGHIGELPVHPDGIPPRVRTEQRGSSRRGPLKAEQQPDRRRLPGTVWTEKPVHLPRGNGEIQRVQRDGRSVSLRKTAGADRCRGGTGGGHRLDHDVPVGLRPSPRFPGCSTAWAAAWLGQSRRLTLEGGSWLSAFRSVVIPDAPSTRPRHSSRDTLRGRAPWMTLRRTPPVLRSIIRIGR